MNKEIKNVKVSSDAHKALSDYARKHDKKIQGLASQIIFLGLKKLEELSSKRK